MVWVGVIVVRSELPEVSTPATQYSAVVCSFSSWVAVATSVRRQIAPSPSRPGRAVMISGGAMRIVWSWVSLASRPRRLQRLAERRAPPASGWSSMASIRPRPRTSRIGVGADAPQAASRKRVPMRGGVLDHALLDQHASAPRAPPRRPAGCRRRSSRAARVAGRPAPRCSRARPRPGRSRRTSALPISVTSASIPSCSSASSLPVRPSPVWISSRISDDAVLGAELADLGEIAGRRDDDAGLALDRLDQEGRRCSA